MKAAPTKRDLKKEWKDLYAPSSKSISLVEAPRSRYLMIDGEGDPGSSPLFEKAMETLYPLAYSLKFASKLQMGIDYVVMPLEGLWWADDMEAFTQGRRDEWKWTLMMLQPEWIDEAMFEAAKTKVAAKKNPELLELARFESYEEGSCVQIMHLGPYDEEGPAIEKLHRKIEELGKRPRLRHHEIYLSDPRRADPAKLKTVLRQPFG